MSKKIMVNCSLMDKEFFDENVKEARKLTWEEVSIKTIKAHQHCIICMVAVPNDKDNIVYRSGNLILCNYCYNTYILEFVLNTTQVAR
jgi:hypothetical protein